ncbi:hypothetical protein SLS59_002657 [Nothophoma quercina]|uniref:Uncharacterized protein n=1 Tax=Nothophoma quercina TaxID=749835 RepID=A0ABR3RRU8_9PLEO
MNERQETFYTARLAPTTPDARRASIDTVSSAADRRRWRNHAHVLTPEPQFVERDPFDDFAVNLPPTSRRKSEDEKTSDESGEEVVEAEEAIEPAINHQGRRGSATLGGNGNIPGPDLGEPEKNQQPSLNDPETRRHFKLPWRERIRHFTWTWFCLTMATGGIANVLYAVPFRFHGLYALGVIFFLLNLALFLFNVTMISCRFYFYPRTFRASFLHPTESLFIPAAIMTPIWIFPAYPLLIIGPHAGSLAPKVSDPTTALQIILGGYIIQGIGFLVSLMIYAAFIYRLMTQKLPKESLRPGMFISVGPSGFTIAGIITMGQELPKVVPSDFMGDGNGELAGRVGMIMANFMGLWLWGLALWFFILHLRLPGP